MTLTAIAREISDEKFADATIDYPIAQPLLIGFTAKWPGVITPHVVKHRY